VALRKLATLATRRIQEIEAAYAELKKLMPNVAAFNSDNPANPYMEGEVNLGGCGTAPRMPRRQGYAVEGLAKRRRDLLDGQPLHSGQCEKCGCAEAD
jgi:spermidine/putrescine-binding protein